MKSASVHPWATGPGEILRHGLELLRKDSDTQARQESLAIARAQRGQSIDTAGRAKGRDALRRGPSRPGRNRTRLPERSEGRASTRPGGRRRSEDNTSELQSLAYLVCR